MSIEREIEALGWRWPSGAVYTLFPFLERGLQFPPPTARQFEHIEFWRQLPPVGQASEESWVSVAATHPCGGKTGFSRDGTHTYWLDFVYEGHGVVRDFVSQFLHAAGRPDLAGRVLGEWRPVEQDRTIDRWTSSDDRVPNGLTLDVDLKKKRRGSVPSGLPTVHFGGRLVVAKDTTIQAIPPILGLEPTLHDLGLGISLSLSNVVWVGLLGGSASDRLPFEETVLELTEANLRVDHLLVVELLKAAGQEHLAELVSENATRGRNDETSLAHQPEPSEELAGSSTEPEDVVLSVDDLVDSILALSSAQDSALRKYLNERIALLRLELGAVDGELGHSDWLFSDQLFSVNGHLGDPLPDYRVLAAPALEVPEWLAVPYNKLQDRIIDLSEQSHDLRAQIEDLRRTLLRAVLIEVEPALEFRRTTEQRLQQRGLGPRPTPPATTSDYFDDYDW